MATGEKVASDAAQTRPPGETARALAARLGLPFVDAGTYPDAPLDGPVVAVKFLRRYRCLPLSVESGRLRVAMADPSDASTP